MKTSFDEIRKIAFRALDAAGAPPGIDDDAGWACAWLEAAGYPGLRMLADLLDDATRDDLCAGLDCSTDSVLDAAGRSGVCFGSLLVEFAASQDSGIIVRALRHSAYLVPHAARLAELDINICVDPAAAAESGVTVRSGDCDYKDERARVAGAMQNGLDVDKQAFDRVYAYSRAILVPQTEQSLLSGAGAGLTDND